MGPGFESQPDHKEAIASFFMQSVFNFNDIILSDALRPRSENKISSGLIDIITNPRLNVFA